ncbi:hypothetical protein Tco_1473663 [Tanacetum coccineum]
MSDSEHSTVTYTSVSEDDLYMGSPGVEVPIYEGPPSPDYIPGPEGPPSPDYVPGPEEPEQAPPSPIYIPFVPEPVYPEFLPVDDEVFPAEEQPLPAADSPTHQSPGYIPESDPEEDLEEDDEEDPADYPADRGDDDDRTLAPCRLKLLLIQLTGPIHCYRVTARCHNAETPCPTTIPLRGSCGECYPYLLHHHHLSHHTHHHFLIYPLHHYLYHHPLALHMLMDLWDPELLGLGREMHYRNDHLMIMNLRCLMCLPLRKRLCRTTPGPGYEVGESSAAGTARRVGPTTARTDLYGFADTLEAAPGRRMSRELGYGIRDTWDDLVGAIPKRIATAHT